MLDIKCIWWSQQLISHPTFAKMYTFPGRLVFQRITKHHWSQYNNFKSYSPFEIHRVHRQQICMLRPKTTGHSNTLAWIKVLMNDNCQTVTECRQFPLKLNHGSKNFEFDSFTWNYMMSNYRILVCTEQISEILYWILKFLVKLDSRKLLFPSSGQWAEHPQVSIVVISQGHL